MSNVNIQWASLLPLLFIFGTAVISTLLEAFLPRKVRRLVQVVFSLLGLLATAGVIIWRFFAVRTEQGIMNNPLSVVMKADGYTGISFVEDGLSLVAQLIIVIAAILAFLVIADRGRNREGAFVASAATRPGSVEEHEAMEAKREQTEIFPLALFATGGMLAFVSAFDLLSLFIALEVLSLPLYVLSATARRRRLLSQEAALKYFLLGAFSSAIFLMGAAFVYGATGTVIFNEVMPYTRPEVQSDTWILLAGLVMVTIGLLFKVGAVPFHSWTPDVYQGAPTPITGFMAAGTKAAAFIALVRVTVFVGGGNVHLLKGFFWIIIITTILVGTVMGLVQKNIKRLLAYSSIAHAGFILIAVAGINMLQMESAVVIQTFSSILFYLLSYGVATVGAFAIVTLLREQDSAGNILGEATTLAQWAGLGKRSPLLAFAMTIFLLSFAGIPLTSGFIGKFEVFRSGILSGSVILVLVAVFASAVTAFFYFRMVQLMFFTEPVDNTVVVKSEGMTVIAITVAVVLTILLGLFPGPVLEMIQGSFA